jgi:hypothetical protein
MVMMEESGICDERWKGGMFGAAKPNAVWLELRAEGCLCIAIDQISDISSPHYIKHF